MKTRNSFARRLVMLFLLGLLNVSCAGPGTMQPGSEGTVFGEQGIRGTLTYQGKPLEGAYVYAYRGFSTNLLGPADFAAPPSGGDGSYNLDLVDGSYYIVARKRATGDNTGPILAGDLYTVHSSNPVTVSKGRFALVDLDLVKMKDPMFFQSMSRGKTQTGIRGRIVDGEGKPVPWVFAMAYSTSDMKRIPEYTSVMTDGDGEFAIFLPKGGTYWLAARKNIREKPVPGEPYGLYTGTPDHSLRVPEKGFVEGITIVLESYHKGIQD